MSNNINGYGRTLNVPKVLPAGVVPGPSYNGAVTIGEPCEGPHCAIPVKPTTNNYISQNLKNITYQTPAYKIFEAINSYSENSEVRYVGGCIRKIIKKETGRIITGSLMRAEYRLYNKDVILRELGLVTLNDLIESWNNLKGLFNVSVKSFLHRYDQKAPPSNLKLKTESDRLKYFFDKYGTRSGWNNYRKRSTDC